MLQTFVGLYKNDVIRQREMQVFLDPEGWPYQPHETIIKTLEIVIRDLELVLESGKLKGE